MPRTPATLRTAALLTVAAAAIPATSQGATLSLDKACYINLGSQQQPIVAAAGGLEANKNYNVTLSSASSGSGFGSGTADASGVATLTMNSWYAGSTSNLKIHKATVTLNDGTTPIATAETRTVRLGFTATGSARLRNWRVAGLSLITGGDTYYAHYFNNRKYKGRLKLGKASGPCGTFDGKRPLTPFSKIGRYEVKVTTTKKYTKGDPSLDNRIVVKTVYRRR